MQESLFPPTRRKFDPERIYLFPFSEITVPDWHPRLKSAQLESSLEYRRLVDSLEQSGSTEPLLLYWQGSSLCLCAGLVRYWAIQDAERRKGECLGVPARIEKLTVRQAMIRAADLNVNIAWSPLQRSRFVLRLEKEMQSELKRPPTMEELSAPTPWKRQLACEALAIGRAFPPKVMRGLDVSAEEVNELPHTTLHEAAREPTPSARAAALVRAVEVRKGEAGAKAGKGERAPYSIKASASGGIAECRISDFDNLGPADAEALLAVLGPAVERLREIAAGAAAV